MDRERQKVTQKGWLAAGVGLAAPGVHYGVVLTFAVTLGAIAALRHFGVQLD